MAATSRAGERQPNVEMMAAIYDPMPIGAGVWTGTGQLVHANPVLCQLLGAERSQLLGSLFEQFIDPADALYVARSVGELWSRARNAFTVEMRCTDPDGGPVWLPAHVAPVLGSQGAPDSVVSAIYDFSGSVCPPSERRQRATAEPSVAVRLAEVVDASFDHVLLVDPTGALTYTNETARRELGVPPALNLHELLDRNSARTVDTHAMAALRAHGYWQGDLKLLRRNGTPLPVAAHLVAHLDEHGELDSISVVARDNTRVVDTQEQLRHLASHDQLTGLANRVLLAERVPYALARSHRSGEVVALLFCDLDRFKAVNDELGHAAGDDVLRAVARRIDGIVRDTDTAARVGGDEFVVLLEGLRDAARVEELARRILAAVQAPIEAQGSTVSVGASIGVVIADGSESWLEDLDGSGPADGSASAPMDQLLRYADEAMYRVKGSGGGGVEVADQRTEAPGSPPQR